MDYKHTIQEEKNTKNVTSFCSYTLKIQKKKCWNKVGTNWWKRGVVQWSGTWSVNYASGLRPILFIMRYSLIITSPTKGRWMASLCQQDVIKSQQSVSNLGSLSGLRPFLMADHSCSLFWQASKAPGSLVSMAQMYQKRMPKA